MSKWEHRILTSPKCSSIYKHVKSVFEVEHYLTKLPFNLRLALSRIRTSNHKLPIETGRYGYKHVLRNKRICHKCESGQIGDEYHFILDCTNSETLALISKYLSPYYKIQPSMNKLKDLFANKGRMLFNLARFILARLKLYWNSQIWILLCYQLYNYT